MNDNDVVARLAEVLTEDVLVPIDRGPVLEALLPVVRELQAEAVAASSGPRFVSHPRPREPRV